MDFRGPAGRQRYDALAAAAARTVVGLDFDGVLAPIVPDPAAAAIHPEGPGVLADLLGAVRAVAVITGRPARQAVALGRLDEVADRVAGGPAGDLLVLGQYGAERWSARTREFSAPSPLPGLAALRELLPSLLASAELPEAHVEDKGIALAVHTRRLADPQSAFDRLLPPLSDAAQAHGLAVEPGRMVIEMRPPGMDKGAAVRATHAELGADGFLFAGDDLGDVAAFDAVRQLRAAGHPGLLVCSSSSEQAVLLEQADLVVDGPDGVLGLLSRLVTDSRAER